MKKIYVNSFSFCKIHFVFYEKFSFLIFNFNFSAFSISFCLVFSLQKLKWENGKIFNAKKKNLKENRRRLYYRYHYHDHRSTLSFRKLIMIFLNSYSQLFSHSKRKKVKGKIEKCKFRNYLKKNYTILKRY